MTEVAVIVEFEIKDGNEEEFAALIRDHARKTLVEEPGCARFEVLKPVDQDGKPVPGRLLVNELYRNEAAFAEHNRNPRLPVLRERYAPMLLARRPIVSNVVSLAPEVEGLKPSQLNASNDG